MCVFTDVVILSHFHDTLLTPQSIYVPDLYNKKIMMKKQICLLNTGWLEYGDYALQRGLAPSTLLVTEVIFNGAGEGGIEIHHHA